MASSHPSLLPVIVDRLWNLMPRRILDVGIGFGKLAFLAREYLDVYTHRKYHRDDWNTVIDGIEIWPDFITDVHRYLYNDIHVGDVMTILPDLPKYDLICIMDVIEHIEKEEGKRLIDIARRHAKKVLISTPATDIPQGDIFGNPYEKHVSAWTPEELGGTCMNLGGMLVCEIDGLSDDVHLITEGPPGWALRHLTVDISNFLIENGKSVHLYDWVNSEDIKRIKGLIDSDPTIRAYACTGPSAEIIHQTWGIPRKNLYFIFHSVDDILELMMRNQKDRPPTIQERCDFLSSAHGLGYNQTFVDVCSQYAGVGYMSVEQMRILNNMGVRDAFYVPQYVDVERFKPSNESHDGPLRVGAALNTISHSARKGIPLLSEIISKIRKRDDMVFDSRAIRGPAGSPGLPYDEMPGYFNDIDVFICTAISEGGPLPPLQAAACEVPCVSTHCGHMPEFVVDGKTGFLTESDSDMFMEHLVDLASNREKLADMGRAARDIVMESWSIEKNGPRWIRMLDKLR